MPSRFSLLNVLRYVWKRAKREKRREKNEERKGLAKFADLVYTI